MNERELGGAVTDAAETTGRGFSDGDVAPEPVQSPGGFVGTTLFVVPMGAPVHSMRTGDWTPARRKQVVDLTKPGHHAQRYGDWIVITWPGSGGYWRRVVQHQGEFVEQWPS